MTTATTICQRAAALVGGDRLQQHGEADRNFENIAKLWSAYLGMPIAAEQVAWLNVLQKCARTKTGKFNLDDYVDAAGYAGIAGAVHPSSPSVLQRVGSGESVKSNLRAPARVIARATAKEIDGRTSDGNALSEASVGD